MLPVSPLWFVTLAYFENVAFTPNEAKSDSKKAIITSTYVLSYQKYGISILLSNTFCQYFPDINAVPFYILRNGKLFSAGKLYARDI